MFKKGRDFILQGSTLLAQFSFGQLFHRFDVGFGPVDRTVQRMIFFGQMGEMRTADFQRMDPVRQMREFLVEFVGGVRHGKSFPVCSFQIAALALGHFDKGQFWGKMPDFRGTSPGPVLAPRTGKTDCGHAILFRARTFELT